MAEPRSRGGGLLQALRVAEFRSLFAAQLVSVAGDQLARVALSILVFDRTRSPGWAAAVYALTFLPDLLGGPLLSGLADRHPRRAVMVAADLARFVLVGAMALPGMPLPVVGALLVGVQALNPVWNAARAALLPHVLPDRQFVAGMGLLSMVMQVGQVVGFATGGLLVAVLGPGGALAVDAGSFAVSAVLVRFGVRHRAAPTDTGDPETGGRWWRRIRAGAALVWTDRRLLALVVLACVSGFYIAGEAVAAPFAAELGGGPEVVGLLLGAYAVGNVAGMAVLARVPEPRRGRLLGPLAVAACAPLIGCAARPGLVVALALFAVSGAASAYNLVASTTFVRLTPDARRAQAFGLALTALRVTQGLGVVGAGLVAEHFAPHRVVAMAGATGVVAAAGAGWLWHRTRGRADVAAPSPGNRPA
ncbi:MFS transporter [Amycolatopsis anabasis]|uniref:MFS transporter n=1 Tax=Amycolatopsis anabasis TaxID=1840409 RepID=UPI00131C30C6|nr:MFS transporter [Amycolatopsis anabasis]